MHSRPSPAQVVAISLLPVLTGIAIPFVHLYLLNKSNLTLPLSVHWPFLAILCTMVFGVGLAIQSLVPRCCRVFASCAVLTVGILAWAEATLLIGDFGFLEGADPAWDEARHLLYFEMLLVGTLGLLFYRLRGTVLDHSVLITTALTLSAMANLYPAYRNQSFGIQAGTAYTFVQNGVLELSPDRNVLLFVIDTFQTDLFAEIVARNPEWRDRLAGFSYFPNATSAFPKTYASVPNILTGKAFDNSEPFSLFLREAYFGNSVPRILKQRGFDVRYQSFTWQPYLPDPALVDNLARNDSRRDRQWMQHLEFVQLLNLTIFRISPFLAKPWAYNHQEFRIRRKALGPRPQENPYELDDDQRRLSAGNHVEDLEVHDTIVEYLSAESDRSAFRVFHFRGLHAPLTIDGGLNAVSNRPITRVNVMAQAEGMLKMLALEFDRLREIGAFDNSTIIVVGDHGAGEYPAMGVHRQAIDNLGLDVEPATVNTAINPRVIQGGLPLILVKRLGDRGSMRISMAPVELGDIPNTIFDELGYDDVTDGPSMFAIPEGQERVRYHRYYKFSGWGQDYIVPLTEYQISGFSWDPDSWSTSGRDLNRNAVDSVEGTLVVLGEAGNLDQFEHAGWPQPVAQGRWLADGAASIRIPTEADSGPQSIEFRIDTHEAPEKPIPMSVSVDDEVIAVLPISKDSPASISTRIPSRFCEGSSMLDIGVELELGDHDDDGLLLIEIRLTSARR